jgi:hypothetical protein
LNWAVECTGSMFQVVVAVISGAETALIVANPPLEQMLLTSAKYAK